MNRLSHVRAAGAGAPRRGGGGEGSDLLPGRAAAEPGNLRALVESRVRDRSGRGPTAASRNATPAAGTIRWARGAGLAVTALAGAA